MKKSKDKSYGLMWKEDIFEIGKQVLLSTRNLQDLATITRQTTGVTKTTTRKLMPLYIGPYTIIGLRGPFISVPGTDPQIKRQVTVELDLPKYFTISSIRHCSELRPFHTEDFNPVTNTRTPPTTANDEFAVDKIIKHDSKTDRYFVQWVGHNKETWEPLRHLVNCQDKLAEYRTDPHNVRQENTVPKKRKDPQQPANAPLPPPVNLRRSKRHKAN
jgi:hypothetical protein